MEFELASYMKDANVLELAAKTNAHAILNDDEQQTVAAIDAWAKELGNTGYDKNHEIAAYITRVVNESISEYPNQVLDMIFDRDSVGEFDAIEFEKPAKNTLKAFETAGGNVERSFIDYEKVTPEIIRLGVETDVKMRELRKNGWLTISKLTENSVQALENKLFYTIMLKVASSIASGDNYIDGTASAAVTQALADQLSLYLHDWSEGNGVIICLSKFHQQFSKLSGYTSYLSEGMKDTIYRNGFLPMYDGHNIFSVGSYRTLGNDGVTKLLPDKMVLGFAGKIGTISQMGEVRTYETEDTNAELVHLKLTGYDHAIGYTNMEKAAKLYLKQN